jgi:tryptophan-rich hypothetical protein
MDGHKPCCQTKALFSQQVILPEDPSQPLELVEIEAVFSKKTKQIPWKELQDTDLWIQGWK